MGHGSSKPKKSKSSKNTSTSSTSTSSKQHKPEPEPEIDWVHNEDTFTSFKQLELALRQKGHLEVCQLIVGVDFTGSNEKQGGPPYYDHLNLHHVSSTNPNPYEQVLQIMCEALAAFDTDQLIDTFGFGDDKTEDRAVFPFCVMQTNLGVVEAPCIKLEGVLQRYREIVAHVKMSGPTSFEPIIRKAIDLVKERNSYHILVIICDGAVSSGSKQESIDAIVEASNYPLSIICIGVGKGPWDTMEHFDDEILGRKFDNFQFVHFHDVMTSQSENKRAEFAKNAMMEVPKQYAYIKKHMNVQC